MDRQKYYGGESASITPLTDVSCWGCRGGDGEIGGGGYGKWERAGSQESKGVGGGRGDNLLGTGTT